MSTYETQLRDLINNAIRDRAQNFNNALHYGAALSYVAGCYPHAEIGIVLSVCDQLLTEGVLWL